LIPQTVKRTAILSGAGEFASDRSGFPFTVRASSDTDFSGLNQFSDRVNLRPGVSNVPTNMGADTTRQRIKKMLLKGQ